MRFLKQEGENEFGIGNGSSIPGNALLKICTFFLGPSIHVHIFIYSAVIVKNLDMLENF